MTTAREPMADTSGHTPRRQGVAAGTSIAAAVLLLDCRRAVGTGRYRRGSRGRTVRRRRRLRLRIRCHHLGLDRYRAGAAPIISAFGLMTGTSWGRGLADRYRRAVHPREFPVAARLPVVVDPDHRPQYRGDRRSPPGGRKPDVDVRGTPVARPPGDPAYWPAPLPRAGRARRVTRFVVRRRCSPGADDEVGPVRGLTWPKSAQ